MSEELCFWPAVRLREAIARREVSPVEVTRAVLQRASRLQPKLNCFITLCPEEAMRDAAAAERAVMRGEATGLLHGIPYACKDLVDTKGVRTTFGSLLYEDNVPTQDAVVIERLRRHGAILIGKTTTSEFGSKCLTDAPLFGRTRNAWDATRTSGGSSGGAAVAVASGLAPIGVATDGGGSTRIPAACNGVVGLKQSIGLVPHSQAEDVIGNLTYVTPISRVVADTALMLQAMAGEDACDPWSAGARAEDYLAAAQSARSLQGKRILFATVPPGRPIASDVASSFASSMELLQSLGAELAEMPASDFDIEPLWRVVNHTVWKARFGRMAEEHGDRMSPSFLQQLELARDYTAVDYQQANFARTQLFRHVQNLLGDSDFIAVPTLMRTALPIGQDLFGRLDIDGQLHDEVRSNWFPWTMPFNLTGHPAITLACGMGRDGLPVGLQLVGRLRRETDLLAAAAAFEAARGLAARWPDVEAQT
ncbi:MAG TPA: amidase [Ramlibacter sp.]|uniref:amidase n=1 Tax=Ramlibacter sp. TaxID=1917967 RepID=UPI002D13718C|nr:amidase [Ramlibacter sp.]HVZ45656.1 amidase [Ramlibacter sp.]